jgi:hypothetical protein
MRLHHWPSRAAVLAAGFLALARPSLGAGVEGAQRPEISFTIHRLKETNVEGPDVERTYFLAGGKRVVFGEPKDCRFTVNDGGILILPASLDGEIRVTRSTFTPEFDLAENALKYRDAAAKNTPRGATQIVVQQPVMNPYPYNGWKSLGFVWTYAFSGRPMTRTVSYINLEVGVQVMVTTLATVNHAEPVNKIAKQFMSAWWVMGK